MPRIVLTKASPNKHIDIAVSGLGTSWTTILEAPDFSRVDPGGQRTPVDPDRAGRFIAPGMVRVLRPIFATNTDTVERWVEFQFVDEAATAYAAPGRFSIPGNTASQQVPLQGMALVKRDHLAANGGRLQARAETAAVIHLWGAALESLSPEHEVVS